MSTILWCLHNIDPWLLQALYAKLFLAGEKIWHETRATSNLRPEAVVWQMVSSFFLLPFTQKQHFFPSLR